MKYKEMQVLSPDELVEKIVSEEEYLMKLKFAHSVSPIENPMKIRQVRRNIARLKTIKTTKLNN